MSDMTVAKEILNQLMVMSKHQFKMMTGAKDFAGDSNSLRFRIGQNCHKINMVKITLTPADTYTVEFLRIRGLNVTVAAKHEDVYFDQLLPIFEKETGMYTRLF